MLAGVDYILTDPPYRLEATGGGIMGASAKDGYVRKNLAALDALACCDFDPAMLFSMVSCALTAFCNKALLLEYLTEAHRRKWVFDVHVMVKNNPVPVKVCAFIPEIEYIVVMRPPGSTFLNDGPFSWYRKVHQTYNDSGKWHPAEKPLTVLIPYIGIHTQPDGIVLDPFMGSGTTLVAAKHLGRQAIGIEIEEKYCAIAVERLRQAVLPLEADAS